MPSDERVLVIPTLRLHELGPITGFVSTRNAPHYLTLLDPAHFQFWPRSEVETDPGFKQLIPYVVLRCGDEFFQYRRGSTGTEKRLAALRSLGIGGHISEEDARGGSDPYRTGMLRELTEEVAIGCAFTETFLGFINDDRTAVGQVHLGVVHLLELDQPAVHARETALADVGFAPLATLLAERDAFETWSQFVMAELAEDACRAL